MRIAITSESTAGLESPVSYHFGRCPYYTIVEVEDGQVTKGLVVPNTGAAGHSPGELPALIKQYGVNVLLTGGMGRRAVDFFTQYGIEGVTGANGTVRTALEQYLSGQLRGYSPCQKSEGHDGEGCGGKHGEGCEGHSRGHGCDH